MPTATCPRASITPDGNLSARIYHTRVIHRASQPFGPPFGVRGRTSCPARRSRERVDPSQYKRSAGGRCTYTRCTPVRPPPSYPPRCNRASWLRHDNRRVPDRLPPTAAADRTYPIGPARALNGQRAHHARYAVRRATQHTEERNTHHRRVGATVRGRLLFGRLSRDRVSLGLLCAAHGHIPLRTQPPVPHLSVVLKKETPTTTTGTGATPHSRKRGLLRR
jgi:hypothetical protein